MQTTLQTRWSGLKAASGLRGAEAAEGICSIPASRGQVDVTATMRIPRCHSFFHHKYEKESTRKRLHRARSLFKAFSSFNLFLRKEIIIYLFVEKN